MLSRRENAPPRGRPPERSRTPAEVALVRPSSDGIAIGIALAVAQVAYLLVTPVPPTYRLTGLVAALVLAVAALLPALQTNRRDQIFTASGIVLGLNLLAMTFLLETIPGSRVLVMVLLLAYVAAVIAVALVLLLNAAFGRAYAATCLALLPVMASEILLQGSPLLQESSRAAAQDGMAIPPRPGADGRHLPGSTWTTKYPDNPRGYFEITGDSQPQWQLQAYAPHATARSEINGNVLRVTPDTIGSEPWHIQLRHVPILVQNGREYEALVRIRASGRRQIRLALVSSVSDGQGVGMTGGRRSVDTSWQAIRIPFRATATDSARFLIDLGADSAALDVSQLLMLDATTGISVARATANEPFVSFRFNSSGCRSGEFPTAKPPRTIRVLALGDAYTLGAGVHERDTWPTRLEALLNAAAARDSTRYEVMNCGVTGAGVGDAISTYEGIAQRYAPDAVVLVLNSGDDQRRSSDISESVLGPPKRIERVFITAWWLRARARARDVTADTSAIRSALSRLSDDVQARGQKLVVAVFEHRATPILPGLEHVVTSRDRRAILTSASLKAFAPSELRVHPTLDRHPNEVAHRILAAALVDAVRAVRPATAPDGSRPPAASTRPARGRS